MHRIGYVSIPTAARRYGVLRTATVDVDFAKVSATDGTWLQDLLQRFAAAAAVKPAVMQEVEQLGTGLTAFAEVREWRRLISDSPRDLRIQDLLQAYRELEGVLGRQGRSARLTRAIFDAVRRAIRRYLQARSDCPQAVLLNRQYRHAALSLKPRELISDQTLHDSGDVGAPLGATRHTTVAELKSKIEYRLSYDIHLIQAACTEQLQDYENLFLGLDSIRKEPRNQALVEARRDVLGQTHEPVKRAIKDYPPRDMLREYLLDADWGRTTLSKRRGYANEKAILQYVQKEFGIHVGRIQRIPDLQLRLNHEILVCILILILAHTAWNVSSALEMRITDVSEERGNFVIQGYKSRTDSFTPQAWVEPRDGAVYKAIQWLVRRYRYLAEKSYFRPGEERLWASAMQKSGKGTRELITLSHYSRKLIKKKSLPDFSFEQIRTQQLARRGIQDGSLNAARELAGHSSIKTTAHYLDQVLLARLNSAVNFEFQQRLERNVVVLAEADSTPRGERHHEDMLYPVGDGTSCADPSNPPKHKWLFGGQCSSRACHSEGGCKNNRILLDDMRIKEVCLTAAFYRSHWQRLASRNSAQFKRDHLEAMLFNEALYGFLLKGPHGHRVRRIERGLNNESG